MSEESIKRHFTGRVIQLNVERVKLPNGRIAALEIVHHPGGAAIAAIDAQQRICLLRQYRHAAGDWVWELPAGKIDDGEPPLLTAQRELEEEAGMQAHHWTSLGDYLSSPGVLTEVVHLYLATGLRAVTAKLEDHEVLEVHWVPFADALEKARNGTIRDGKSVVGIFRASAHL